MARPDLSRYWGRSLRRDEPRLITGAYPVRDDLGTDRGLVDRAEVELAFARVQSFSRRTQQQRQLAVGMG